MKRAYIDKSFSRKSMALIETANQIIDEYRQQGYDLTLRQLYYQLVARDILPNQQKQYKRLGNIIGEARLAGLVSWRAIVDRTRHLSEPPSWSSPGSIIDACAHRYAIDLWEGQRHRIEVWVEKDALRGVISRTCARLNVPDFSCRGYVSLSEMWATGNRLKHWIAQDVYPVIIHLGDHDPSGIDMTRDITERLEMFSGGFDVIDFKVVRAALNYDQIAEYNPPPNPAKSSDSRANGYVAEFGRSSWELDALDPATLDGIITDIVDSYRNDDLYSKRLTQQTDERKQLQYISENFEEITGGAS